MAAPNDIEKELIPKFRERLNDVLVSDEQKSDPYLIRWLRAREHDLEKAEEMLRNSLKWREEHKIHLIIERKFDPWYESNFPYWIDSTDKTGHPVMEVMVGSWDFRRVISNQHECDFQYFISLFFERILQRIRDINKQREEEAGETSWPLTQWTVIVDWKGYSHAQLIHWKAIQDKLKFHVCAYEAYYPEVLYKTYFINCPSIFPMLMSFLKTVIAPRTLEKIGCYSLEEEWKPLLLRDIGEDNLGHMYGGKKVRMVGDKMYNYEMTWQEGNNGTVMQQ